MAGQNPKVKPTIDPTGVPIKTDTVGANDYQVIKASFGPDGSATHVDDADGSRFPIGGGQIGAKTETAPVTDIASSGLNGRLQRIAQNITALGTTSLTTLVGALTETAPASDTASSGLNGRLQRIAQRLTSLIALIPAALTSGGGIKVGLVDAIIAGTNIIGKILRAETTFTLTVANGATVSGAADLAGYSIINIVVPSTFDGTSISFQVSADATTYQALYDANNILVSMTVGVSKTYAPWGELQGHRAIKIVTATSQTGATDFVIQVQS